MDAPATISSHPPGLLTIAFFGLGTVGSSMLICLSELAERDDVPLLFVVVVVNVDLARDALFHAERLFTGSTSLDCPISLRCSMAVQRSWSGWPMSRCW